MTDDQHWQPIHPEFVAPQPQFIAATPTLASAFGWSWAKFRAHARTIIGAAALWAAVILMTAFVGIMVLGVTVLLMVGGGSTTDGPADLQAQIDPASSSMLIVNFVAGLVIAVLGALVMSCWLNGMSTLADGGRCGVDAFFKPAAPGQLIVVGLTIGLVSAAVDVVATLATLSWISLPASLAISMLTVWTWYFAADSRQPARQALTNGLNLAVGRIVPTLVVMLVTVALSVAGLLALIVGLLVTVPLGGLLTMYYFRALTGRPIAA